MSMDTASPAPTAASETAQESRAPRIPIERHVVACVQALERIRANADQTLFVMRNGRFDDPTMWAYITAIMHGSDELHMAYAAYQEVTNCEGQA